MFYRKSRRLTPAELTHYQDEGFLLVSGLIRPDVVARAVEGMKRRIRTSDGGSLHAFVDDPSVLACFSESVCSVASQLAGAARAFVPPATVYTISVVPESLNWHWPEPHIDHARKTDAHRTFPPPFAVGCLIYLTPISQHAGGTVVWPGSHRQLESIARSRPEDFEFLYALNEEIAKVPLRNPVEILTEAGDVLFYHYLCAHAGSTNTGDTVRLALNHKW